MAVNEATYSRTFLSRTGIRDISHHGSPIDEDYQTISEEDEDIRKRIEKKFEFHRRGGNFFGSVEMFGFDGKLQYSYIVRTEGLSSEKSSENVSYQTEVRIRKAGAKYMLDGLSDLEEFLVENQFQRKD